MTLDGKNIGVAFTGSFCTYEKIFTELTNLVELGANVYPIFSFNSQTIDSRFGKAKDFLEKAHTITKHKVLTTITDVEPLGPNDLLDILLISPCTGNTLAKLANGIADTPVLMAAKGHLRNNKPLLISLSSNDSLGNNFKNIGALYNYKNIYFVPFGQDNYKSKPNSMISHTDLIVPSLLSTLDGKQLQPVLV